MAQACMYICVELFSQVSVALNCITAAFVLILKQKGQVKVFVSPDESRYLADSLLSDG